MITPAIVPPLLLDPVSAPLDSFAEVESLIPDVEEAEVGDERPALVVGDVVEAVEGVLRTGARRAVEEELLVVDGVERVEMVVDVSSSSSVEVTVGETRAVVRRVVLLRGAAEVAALLSAAPRPGASVTASSSLAVVRGWPVGEAAEQDQLDVLITEV